LDKRAAYDLGRAAGLDFRKGECMWVLYLEAGVALGLFAFIVWWVTRSGPKKKDHTDTPDDKS
jgi:hypothetical protein